MKHREGMTSLAFRIEEKLKEDFQEACKNNDETTSQVLRKYIRSYLEKAKQKELIKQD